MYIFLIIFRKLRKYNFLNKELLNKTIFLTFRPSIKDPHQTYTESVKKITHI